VINAFTSAVTFPTS